MGYGKEDRGRAYSAGEADAECAGGELSRTAARRVFERELVSEPVRCQARDRGLENGVQRRASAQQLRLSHAEGVCSARNNEKTLAKNQQAWKNAEERVSHFPTAPMATADDEVQ